VILWTVDNMKALFARAALYSSSPILPQAAFPALPARGGAAGAAGATCRRHWPLRCRIAAVVELKIDLAEEDSAAVAL
jgi:hypothetical protein